MLLLLILLIITLVLVWVVLKWLKIANYWAERNVPYLTPHPILGSLTFLLQENSNIWMRRMYNHFKTPYFGIWLFWRPALVVNSPEIARNILIKDSAIFRNKFMNSGKSDPLDALNLLTLNAIFADYTTDVIGTFAFGVGGNATTTGEGPLSNVTKEFMKFSIFRGLSWCSIFFFPELVDIFKFKFYPISTVDYFRRLFRQMISERKASSRKVANFLDALMKIQNEDINKEYSEDFFVAQAAILLLGGFDSTATLLTFITYELAYNPDIQERLYQELLKSQKKYGEQNLSYEALGETVYLNCVIKETLRKYPSMGWLDRVAAEDYKIDENLTIKAGTPVYINATGIQLDTNHFPDPHTLDPDRFLPENQKNIVPYTYLPFGDGPRVCLGQTFGFVSVRSVLSSLLLNYEIHQYEDCPNVSDIKIEKRGMFYMPGEDLSVKFIPRSK